MLSEVIELICGLPKVTSTVSFLASTAHHLSDNHCMFEVFMRLKDERGDCLKVGSFPGCHS
jgi:hypothetical protein